MSDLNVLVSTTYCDCPICGGSDTPRKQYSNGAVVIECSRQECASNGGRDSRRLMLTDIQRTEKFNTLPITVVVGGSSGIELRANLSKKYNLVEYSLNDAPVPIFISPWMQFEPSEMNNEREQIAHEIARRVRAHELLIKENTRLRDRIEKDLEWGDRMRQRQADTIDLWKQDRKRAGFPDDFSDIKTWPVGMMGDYV